LLKKTIERLKNRAEMNELGFGANLTDVSEGIINKDGTFNVKRTGIPFSESFGFFHFFINMSWLKFCMYIILLYTVINLFFTSLYFLAGIDGIHGLPDKGFSEKFLFTFFFSTQTFTTVGYGTMAPAGIIHNIISSIESLVGLLSLAFATGLLYGRFSKPVAKILFSENALIAPFKNLNALQFRVANQRMKHEMIEVEVTVIFTIIENIDGNLKRQFFNLELEYSKISFFASTWTVNHVINENSPLYGLVKEDLEGIDAEFLILLKGFDTAYAQIVQSLYSYRFPDIVWGAKFTKIYDRSKSGKMRVKLDSINDYDRAELNTPAAGNFS
jgi:inward rectifier potassium channel